MTYPDINPIALDFETAASYELTITATKDGTADATAQVTINITDVQFSITADDSTIDHTADCAVQRNIIQLIFAGKKLFFVLLFFVS